MTFSDHHRKKSFGQYWLKDEVILDKIIAAANLKSNDRILEIGPGRGALTRKLLDSEIDLLQAIEIDKTLISALRKKFSCYPKFKLIEGDVLSLPLLSSDGMPFDKVVANIPYNITGPILNKLIGKLGSNSENNFQLLVLLLQKEVADRIIAKPGESCFSSLSVRLQLLAKCSSVCEVPSSCFNPPPKVNSKVIIIEPVKPQNRLPFELEHKLQIILSTAFLERRKKLRNTLISLNNLQSLQNLANDIGISLDQRPQELSPMNWVDLAKRIPISSKLSSKKNNES